MNTDELIRRLVADARPVRALPPPYIRLSQWIAVSMAVTAASVLIAGMRPDLLSALRAPFFEWTTALLLATAVAASAAALVLGMPGAARSLLPCVGPLVLAFAWPAALIIALVEGGGWRSLVELNVHGACGPLLAGIAAIPAWMLLRMVRSGAPMQPAWIGAFAALGATTLGAAALQLICPIDAPAHLLVEHVLPVTISSLAGAVAGRRWLAFRRPHQFTATSS